MASQIINPASVAQTGLDWSNLSNALAGDNDNNAINATPGGAGYLVFAIPVTTIPAGATITGIKVDARVSDFNYTTGGVVAGKVRTLSVEISKDGVNYVGVMRRTPDFTGVQLNTTYALGGLGHLWGQSWYPSDFARTTLAIRVRRPVGLSDEDAGGNRALESIVVTVFYDPAGAAQAMPQERISSAQQSIVGRESPRGTEVAPSIRLKATKLQFNPKQEVVDLDAQGELLPIGSYIETDMSEASIGGFPTFDEIGLVLASVISKPVTSQLAAGAYRHEFNLNVRGPSDPQTYTHEYGDTGAAERVAYALVTELAWGLQRKQPKLTGKAIGRKVQDKSARTAGAATVMTITLGTATSIQLRYNGASTPAITGTINAASIQSALQALSTVGAGNMLVSGTGPLTLTTAGALLGDQVPLVEVVAAGGGTAPTIAYATKGGYTEFDCVPIAGSQIGVYYAADRTGLGQDANKLRRLFEGDVSLGNRFAEVWGLDDSQDSFMTIGETAMAFGTSLTVAADAIAQGIAADARAQARKYLRIAATGSQIGATGINRSFTIDMFCQPRDLEAFKDASDVVFAREFGFGARYDTTWGRAAQIVLVNNVPSYAG